ncbi:MAG: putative ATP-dependent Clp protease [Actinomycetia bacterium]|nr:putative ATP-dependent Clp protease [Actinomycetes bacterium]
MIPQIPRLQTFADGPTQWHDWALAELLESRTVVLDGPVDSDKALAVSAELMLLDGEGDDAVQLRIESAGGTLDGALMLMDVIDLLGVPVQGTCMGRAEGAALFVLAVCPERVVGPHARLHLSEPPAVYEGFRDVAGAAEHHRARLDQVVTRLATVMAVDEDELRHDLHRGRFLRPEEAVELHLADQVATPEASIRRFPRRVGYRLR